MFKNTESLKDRHQTLMNDIMICDNMIDPDNWEDQGELISELEDMSEELEMLEEIIFLKTHVDCDCIYNPVHPGK